MSVVLVGWSLCPPLSGPARCCVSCLYRAVAISAPTCFAPASSAAIGWLFHLGHIRGVVGWRPRERESDFVLCCLVLCLMLAAHYNTSGVWFSPTGVFAYLSGLMYVYMHIILLCTYYLVVVESRRHLF